jgi:hypothetical protein
MILQMPSARKLATVAVMLAVLVLTAPPASASGSGGILVVGDSLEELTSPYLQRYLPGATLTVNAVGGSNSFQIFGLFQESYDPSQSVIVFDAGTNDNPAYPEILAENLEKVAVTVGDRCMVVPTIHGFTVDGIDNTGKNSVVRSFAASRPGTQVPDWAGAVAAHPELMQADGLHPVPAGADLRAWLIAQGIKGCLGITAAAQRGPALASGPNLPPAHKLARREATLLDGLIARALALLPIPLAGDA